MVVFYYIGGALLLVFLVAIAVRAIKLEKESEKKDKRIEDLVQENADLKWRVERLKRKRDDLKADIEDCIEEFLN